jgi:CubicO group peptidase (beta-lactamase class C family)
MLEKFGLDAGLSCANRQPARVDSLVGLAAIFAVLACCVTVPRSIGQETAPVELDARASDPVVMGWMVGAPPPPDKLVLYSDASWLQFPRTRWSFSHARQLLPTSAVSRGVGPAVRLSRAERSDIDAVTFQPIGRSTSMTWADSLAENYTDGILVMHRGRVVYERYFGALEPDRPHLAFSVTKSIVATIAATLISEGVLDDGAPVAQYLPELANAGAGNATVRQLLDMRTGLDYSEDYADPKSSAWELARAAGLFPRPEGYEGPRSLFDYFMTVGQSGPHGEMFDYKSVNTDILGALLRRVTGKSLSVLLSDRLFSQLGVENDAYFVVDPTGAELAGGGLNLTLRDMARFGEMMRLDGQYNGQQIVPKAVIDDIRRGGDPALFAQADYRSLPGWSYRNMWWVAHDAHGVFAARGIHGQTIYIDPLAEMVIVRFASHPQAANSHYDATSLPAFAAVARHLMRVQP